MPLTSYRSFEKALEDLASQWSGSVSSQDEWQDLGPFGGSESKPFRVQNGPFIGLAKPGERKGDGIARAAHEKIVSDLAYLLLLPVPPVILWDRGETRNERFVSISAWAFSPAWPWDQAAAQLTEKHKVTASEVVSAMLVFEAWVSAQDRKSDHLLVNVQPDGSPQLAFVDYAYSLSYSWPAENAGVGPPGPYVPVTRNESAMRSMTESILQVRDETINTIVSRVPADYLPVEKNRIIISNLMNRKAQLRPMLGLG